MSKLTDYLTPAHLAGYAAVVVGVVDAWAFHASFGLEWDKGLVLAGLAWLGGVMLPSPLQKPPG